jgi:hypothetical protein
MIELGLASLAALAGAAFGGWVGYRRGAHFAASEIARVFQYKVVSTDNDLEGVPKLLARPSLAADGSLRKIADKLHFAAWNEGMETEARSSAPKHDEAAVTMPKKDLGHVAWLADLGFRAWISDPSEERPPYEEAERVANVLETFERRIVPNLLAEAPEEKECRFTAAENRTHRLWRVYGKL